MSHEKNTRRTPPCLQITESVDVKKSTTSGSVTFGSKGDSSLMDGSIKSRYCHAVFTLLSRDTNTNNFIDSPQDGSSEPIDSVLKYN